MITEFPSPQSTYFSNRIGHSTRNSGMAQSLLFSLSRTLTRTTTVLRSYFPDDLMKREIHGTRSRGDSGWSAAPSLHKAEQRLPVCATARKDALRPPRTVLRPHLFPYSPTLPRLPRHIHFPNTLTSPSPACITPASHFSPVTSFSSLLSLTPPHSPSFYLTYPT